jgi:N-acetyltransferase 10
LTVAVKTGEKKRKAGEAVNEAYQESIKHKEKGEKKHKKAKQSRN